MFIQSDRLFTEEVALTALTVAQYGNKVHLTGSLLNHYFSSGVQVVRRRPNPESYVSGKVVLKYADPQVLLPRLVETLELVGAFNLIQSGVCGMDHVTHYDVFNYRGYANLGAIRYVTR